MGIFPGGASPYGVDDAGGSVWEWCATQWREKRDEAEANTPALRVVKGGSWFETPYDARCARRSGFNPNYWFFNFGFRVCRRAT